MTENHNKEDFKFLIANHMQSFAAILLSNLLDKKQSISSSSSNSTNDVSFVNIDGNNPLVIEHQQPFIERNCRNELVKLSSGALRNEQWSLKGKY